MRFRGILPEWGVKMLRKPVIRLLPLGDRALLASWELIKDESRPWSVAAAAAGLLREMNLSWVSEIVPAFDTLAIHFRGPGPSQKEWSDLAEWLNTAKIEPAANRLRTVELPTVYGGADGPDLAACASRSGMSETEFVRRHAEVVYEVTMIGFSPGFPYLAGLDPALAQPRRDSPRKAVAEGSVGIAGGQTGIYPIASPGGWQLIGRTSERLFRPVAVSPFLLSPGDRVKFVPISVDERDGIETNRGRDGFAGCGFNLTTDDGTDPQTIDITGRKSDEVKELQTKAVPSRHAVAAETFSIAVLEVESAGLMTTVQDLGRQGWQAWGVSVGGAMDTRSLRTANLLVGNDEQAAGLEMTMNGGHYRILADTTIAVCGAEMEAAADESTLPMNRPVSLRAGCKLTFGHARAGCRTYLAIAGGIDVPVVLGSRSTDPKSGIGGMTGRALVAGDILHASVMGPKLERPPENTADPENEPSIDNTMSPVYKDRPWTSVPWFASASVTSFSGSIILRVVAGAEWEKFGTAARDTFSTAFFRVMPSSDRMGVRLNGPSVMIETKTELRSHGVAAGTIQVPAGGAPIILGAACQSTGGYPKLAHVIAADLPLLAQAAPGAEIRFRLVSLPEAAAAYFAAEREIAELRAGLRLKTKQHPPDRV